MRIHNRLLLISALAVACFSVQAQEAVNDGMWSDSSTWSGGSVPQADSKVTIGSNIDVVLDVSPPELGGMTISGKLGFADNSDLSLSTEWIMLHGELEIGTEAKPFTHKATITLTDNVKDEQLMGMGDRGIMLSGGTLNLHGNITNTWTKLAETAEAGSNSIKVLNAAQWQVGDEIVLASTDYNPRQAETRHITAINGNAITLDEPLEYMHFGEITFNVDERGEVGLLTRNIKVQSSEDSLETYFGGHIMAMVTSKMYVEGVELHRMGQHMELARYPIHWHLVGDAGNGQYIKNAAIHDTFNRCVTVHGTNDLRIENNVTYNTVGHCFFMEDGIEHGNEFVKNLAIQTKCHPTMDCVPTNLAASGEFDYENRQAVRKISFSAEHTLLPSDNTVSSYWITNPDNTYIDNVAAGSDENGFWLSLPEHPNGAFLGSEDSLNTWPRRTRIREFRGNVAHSNFDGFMFDRNINVDNTFGLTGNSNMTHETCEIHATWNAAVCTGDIGRLFFNEPDSGFPGLAAGSPVTVLRNGKDHRITANQSNVRSGSEIRVNTDREELYLSVREMNQGSWVIFELPGYDHAASGLQQDSMEALRSAGLTSWFKAEDTVWVKLVVSDVHFQGPVLEPVGRLVAQTTIQVIR